MIASFVMAGFECTYAQTAPGHHIDMLAATMHDEYCQTDYELVQNIGIKTVREGLSWHQIDQGNHRYDFSRFKKIMQTGQDMGIQQIWDLNHFDYPDRLNPFSKEFIIAFADYAQESIKVLRRYISGTIYIAPINEISFFAWIGADMGWWAPFTKGRRNGFRFKVQLTKAAIAAMDAIWSVDDNVRFIQIDPFMRRLAKKPAGKTAVNHVNEFNNIVRFEAWDMLAGKRMPELGGHPKYLDIIGVNYYVHNQEWVISHPGSRKLSHQLMDWQSSDRVSFADMLQDIYERYRRPLIISETGSFGPHREAWWKRTLAEIETGRKTGLPIKGVCIYPTVDRPESVKYLIPNSGVWDFNRDDPTCFRIPHKPSLNVIKKFNRQVNNFSSPKAPDSVRAVEV